MHEATVVIPCRDWARPLPGTRDAGSRRPLPRCCSRSTDCIPERDWAVRHLQALADAPDAVLATAGQTVPAPSADPWSQRDADVLHR